MLSPLEVGVEDQRCMVRLRTLTEGLIVSWMVWTMMISLSSINLGYNLLPSEVSAAFALEQLKSLMKRLIIGCATFII